MLNIQATKRGLKSTRSGSTEVLYHAELAILLLSGLIFIALNSWKTGNAPDEASHSLRSSL